MNKDDIELARKKYPLASLPSKAIFILAVLSAIVFILSVGSMISVLLRGN